MANDDTQHHGHHHRIVSARGLDLDALEQMMNRRLRMLWVRHTWVVTFAGFLLFCSLVGLSIFLTTKATVLRIAVGPEGSPDVNFVEILGDKLKSERAPFKIVPMVQKGPVTVSDIRGKPAFDLAIVRGNMDLSQDWPVVAILRQNVVALIVPAKSAHGPVKDAKGKPVKRPAVKIENVADLVGRTVGILASTDGGPELLQVILDHYGVPQDKVKVETVELKDLSAAIYDNKIDVVLAAGPETGKLIGDAVSASSHGKDGATFVAIDQAEGIGKRTPPYASMDVAPGAFGGVPPQPAEEMKTLAYPLYLVARKTFNGDKIALFSKYLYADRQSLAYALPGVVAIESPSTDKDAAVLVHDGAAEYLGDNQKSFFDKYGDEIFYGMLIIPALGSALAGAFGYLRSDKNTRRIRQLHRLLQLVKKARAVNTIEELDQLQEEADAILGETIQEAERGALDETAMATFSLAIQQARLAISDQRTVLVLRPDLPNHHSAQLSSMTQTAAE